jgi:hypothetical protein
MLTIKEKELQIEQEKTKIACYKENRKDVDAHIGELNKKLTQRKKGSNLNEEMKKN